MVAEVGIVELEFESENLHPFYKGPLFVGSSLVRMEMIYDTMSSLTAFGHTDTNDNMEASPFNIHDSKTLKQKKEYSTGQQYHE